MSAHLSSIENVPTFSSASAKQQQCSRLDLAVEGVTCPACMITIEQGVGNMPGISRVLFNYSTHRLTVEGDTRAANFEAIIGKLDALGYRGRPYELSAEALEQARRERHLLRAMAVAGFASANIMMMSVAVWSGNATGMEESTRDLLHWLSALIAFPAVNYAGMPFFESAFRALKGRHLNMDVPISLAVILAVCMSLVQTLTHQPDAYFDSATMLLFFLLIGRYLDLRARNRTKDLGQNLMALQKPTVIRLHADGSSEEAPISLIEHGEHILIPAGTRIGVDGTVLNGASEVDTSLITGETAPRLVQKDDVVYAGTLNIGSPLIVSALAAGENTLLSEISALIDKAMEKRGTYVRLADKAASLYAPVVHLMALATLIGWLLAGYDWQSALLAAIAVLIITCPCALGLAVPVVQVVATGALFRRGLLVNAGDALERAAIIDTIVFDKTGTLTEPDPAIANLTELAAEDLRDAARLARSSHHVLARALSPHAGRLPPFKDVTEIAGMGVHAEHEGMRLRLGSRLFCDPDAVLTDTPAATEGRSELWFRRGDAKPVGMYFRQDLKPDAVETIEALRQLGLRIEILSGDRRAAVERTAAQLGIADFIAEMQPRDKIAHIETLRQSGHQVMMIGDGLNDAAALQAANVSVAPASALDITQAAADVVLVGTRLAPLTDLIRTSRKARRLIFENFFFAVGYNVIAVPLAIIGLVTPLIAALFMSGSSVVVTLNALRAQIRDKVT